MEATNLITETPDGPLLNPTCVLEVPSEPASILTADHLSCRISQFTTEGRFIRHLIKKEDKIKTHLLLIALSIICRIVQHCFIQIFNVISITIFIRLTKLMPLHPLIIKSPPRTRLQMKKAVSAMYM